MDAGVVDSANLEQGAAGSRITVKPYKYEGILFAISLGLSVVFWALLVLGTLGGALLWILAIFVAYLFAHSAFIAYVKGTAVRLGPNQSPQLYERLRKCAEGVGVYPVPEVYVVNGEGLLNAMATRFLGRNFLVLFSDVVDALERHPQALNFYIGHELAHIKRKHLSWGPVLWPASILPLLGPAYSRAREYTCDAYGQACCEKASDAAVGLAVLAAGPSQWTKLDVKSYAAQSEDSRGFWMSFHELVGDYPWLVKRMEHVKARATRAAPAIPRRSVLAWLLASLVPRLGIGGNPAGLLVMVAVIGILAAVAIPSYQEYVSKAEAKTVFGTADQVAGKIADYIAVNGAFPETLEQVGVPSEFASDNIRSVQLTETGVQFTLFGATGLEGETVVYSPYVEDERLYWDCSGGSLKPALRPESCRN